MKRLIVVLVAAVACILLAPPACTYTTYFINGRMQVCATCCNNFGQCTVSCY